jgi:hypothetical protein
VLVSSSDNHVRVWDIATGLNAADRKYLAAFARALSTAQVEASGRISPQVAKTWNELRSIAVAAGAGSAYREWFFADPAQRALTPFAPAKIPAYIEARIAEGTDESLNEAAVLAESDAALRQRIEEKRATVTPGR